MAPDDVGDHNSLKVFETLYHKLLTGDCSVSKPLFKVGMKVRPYINKTLFVKGDKPNFSRDIATVSRVIRHRPEAVYEITDSKGVTLRKRFYAEELSRVTSDDGKQ